MKLERNINEIKGELRKKDREFNNCCDKNCLVIGKLGMIKDGRIVH